MVAIDRGRPDARSANHRCSGLGHGKLENADTGAVPIEDETLDFACGLALTIARRGYDLGFSHQNLESH